MRIAIVSDYYYPQLGGITEHVHGQAAELTRRGHEVTVVTGRLLRVPPIIDGEDCPPASFEVLRLGRALPVYANRAEALVTVSPRLRAQLEQIQAHRRFDVVHVHNPIGPGLPQTAVRRSTAPVTVGTLHSVVPPGYPLLRVLRRPLARVVARLDACVCVSDAVVDSLSPFFPLQDFVTIPNGIDSSFFSPAVMPLPALAGKRTILFVGRFDPRNGVGHAIGAFRILRRSRDDVRLVIVGDGPLYRFVARLVPAELRDDVVFAGRVNRLRPRYLASADVLCAPCSLASFGMVVLEAMSAGVPIVATRLPGFARVMRDGIDGLMIDDPEDEAGFAAALAKVLDDRLLARRLGAAGRARAVAVFDWAAVGAQLEELYARLLGSGVPRAEAAHAA